MKKLLAILMLFAVLLGTFCSCAKESEACSINDNTKQTDELYTEDEKETVVERAIGGSGKCIHGEESPFHFLTYSFEAYVGSDKFREWENREGVVYHCLAEDSDETYDVLNGLNIYSFVHSFNIPRDVFELITKYHADYYLFDYPTDLVYADTPDALNEYYIKYKNLGENDAEYRKNYADLDFERELLDGLFMHMHFHVNEEYPKEIYDKLEKAKALNKTGFSGADPDYSCVFSIPEIIKIFGLNRRTVERLYNNAKIGVEYKDIVSDYDLDYIFDLIEGKAELDERFAKAGVMDTDCDEVTFEMLDANREFNAYLRSR